jgi:outer membrane protein assembly factor BamB
VNGALDRSRLRLAVVISAGFLAVVGIAMLVNHARVAPHDPLTSRVLAERKDQLRGDPANEQLKQEIRALDLQIRQRFFQHLAFNQTGARLLLGGLVVLLISARQLAARHATPPAPKRRLEDRRVVQRQNLAGRRALAVTAALVTGLTLLLTYGVKTLVPDSPEALARLLGGEAHPTDAGPSSEELRNNWPRFRGPSGDGVAIATNLPMDWNGSTGKGIAWKAPVPLPGFSSPIVWNDRVFVTGGNETTRAVFCYSARDGSLAWQGLVPNLPAPPGGKLEVQEFTGIAASTPTTDGQRVFAIFATGELVAFHNDGRLAWAKHLGVPENPYGFATSLVLLGNKLFVQYDQGQAEQQRSRLYALDTATGRVIWEQRRALPSSWTTPLLIESATGPQLILTSQPLAMAYDPLTGRELWRADCLGADLAPSPVFAHGLLYVVHPSVAIIALRVDGTGDVTQSHVAWRYEEGAPDITSPVTDGTHLFMITTWGTITCLDARSGAHLAEKDLDLEFNASPLLVGNRLLLVGIPGVALVLSANPALELLQRAELGEPVHASPALVDGRLYVRSKEHLHAMGHPASLTLTYGP